MRELTYTEQDAEQHVIDRFQSVINRKIKSLATRTFIKCVKIGLRAVEIQKDWLKDNPNTELPYWELSHSQTVEAWELGIGNYKESLKN